MTDKSVRESLGAWAIEELVGHYVNYRKVFAPNVPATDFGLYAVSTRYPRQQLGFTMAYTIQDLYRDFTRQHLSELTPEERMEGIPTEERLRGLPPEERHPSAMALAHGTLLR